MTELILVELNAALIAIEKVRGALFKSKKESDWSALMADELRALPVAVADLVEADPDPTDDDLDRAALPKEASHDH